MQSIQAVLPPPQPPQGIQPRGGIRFDRNELAGAFGDIGTDLPLIIGMILAAHLDAASVLIMFGLMQILTALTYRMPMPVQPLKAVAALVIAQKLSGNVLYGAGLAIGIAMLLLSVTGGLGWLARMVPKCVVRGIQLGLGLQLATLALKDYVPADGWLGYGLAVVAGVIAVALLGNRKYPAALFIIALGVLYAAALKLNWTILGHGIGLRLPQWHLPAGADIWTGFLVLALPQIPLSLGNSILATRQISQDLFPDKAPSVKKIGITYALMNLINPFFQGVPTCHGSGGMAGHYAFGARTGGSVILYGCLYLGMGLFFSPVLSHLIQVFPLPMLGVILLFEGLTLTALTRDMAGSPADFRIALLVGLLVIGVQPYGYVIGLVVGTILAHCWPKRIAAIGTH